MIQLMLGDCLEKLTELPDSSVDSIVTDPPYGLSFMGKAWDYDVPATNIWVECLRVLKPGGHLLSFFGTRTYHRGVCRIEDAGFTIKDQIQWIYGSGFPKSHNLKGEWQGWGCALKPANEPIVVAQKPISEKTIAANVLKWGTGALNIDGSRIGYQSEADRKSAIPFGDMTKTKVYGGNSLLESKTINDKTDRTHAQGRWPANVIFDEEAAKGLDGQSGQLSQCGGPKKTTHDKGMFGIGTPGTIYREENRGASRFFYVAKASKKERGSENIHPTVKPTKLMSYLTNLVTPPNGVVLDPFMGSGSTGVAAKNLNRSFIGIEREPQYFEIAQKRIESAGVVIEEKVDDGQLEFGA